MIEDIFDDYDFKIRIDYIYPDYKDKEEYVLDRFEQLFSQADNVYDFLIEENHGYITSMALLAFLLIKMNAREFILLCSIND